MEKFEPISDSRLVYREVSFSIPANTSLPVAIQFQMMKVIACSNDNALVGSIGYSTDTIRLAVGLGYGVTAREVDEGKFYNALAIQNTTGATVTISIAFAFGNITDDRITIGGSINVTGIVDVQGGTAPSITKAEDAPHTSGDAGVMSLGVRNDGLATAPVSANGDYIYESHDSKGAVFVKPANRTYTVSQVSVGTTATALISATTATGEVVIGAGNADLFIGTSAAVTTANGFLIPAGGYFSLNGNMEAFFGIRAVAAQTAYTFAGSN